MTLRSVTPAIVGHYMDDPKYTYKDVANYFSSVRYRTAASMFESSLVCVLKKAKKNGELNLPNYDYLSSFEHSGEYSRLLDKIQTMDSEVALASHIVVDLTSENAADMITYALIGVHRKAIPRR